MNDEPTCSTQLHFLCSCPKNIQHLNHYHHHRVCHCWHWWHLGINFQSSKEIFDTLKYIDKDILACFYFLGCLRSSNVTRADSQSKKNEVTYLEKDTHTDEYHFGRGEYLLDQNQNEIVDRSVYIFTKLIPAPSVSKNA